MILISHRGNLYGKNKKENSPEYIDEALKYYNCEIDIWVNDTYDIIHLGHDSPTYKIDYQWLNIRKELLWIHCKNENALVYLSFKKDFNYFFHDSDKYTLTSKRNIWTYPGKIAPVYNGITVLPEYHITELGLYRLQDIKNIETYGICSDFIGLIN